MVVVDDFVSAIKFDINKILLAGEPDEIDRYKEILANRYDGLLDIYKSAPYFLEIMPFGVTKGSMLPLLIDKLGFGYSVLFPYAVVFSALSFVTMSPVKHGDSKPIKKASVLENFDTED